MRGRVTSSNHSPKRPAQNLEDFPAFGFLDTQHVEGLPPAVNYPAGMEVFREADPSEDVFHLEHGLVKLLRTHSGGEELIIGLRSAGWFLAAASAVLSLPCAATAVTVTPCRIARVRAEAFRQRIQAGGPLSWSVHRMHCEELHAQLGAVTDLTVVPARQRLEQFLRRLAGGLAPPATSGEVRFSIPLRHWEVAQLIGVTAPYLSQLLAELEGDGIIRREKQTVVLRT